MYKSDMEIVKSLLLKESIISGNTIQIPYSVDGAKALLRIAGGMKQEIREGYNLLNITAKSINYNGVMFTNNQDGTVILNGTLREGENFGGLSLLINNKSWSADDFPWGKEVTFKVEGLVEGVNLTIAEADETGAWTKNIAECTSQNNKVTTTPVRGETTQFIRCNFSGSAGIELNNITIKPMLYIGTEDKAFQQYGVSPSLEYPSEIQAVGDEGSLRINIENNKDPHQEQNKSICLKEPLYGNNEARDKIVRKDGKWQYKREFGKYIFTGNEIFDKHGATSNNLFYLNPARNPFRDKMYVPKDNEELVDLRSNYFKGQTVVEMVRKSLEGMGLSMNKDIYIGTSLEGVSTTEELGQKFKEYHDAGVPVYIIYPLKEPEYEEIIDKEMIRSLDENQYIIEYDEETNISADNELAILEVTAVQNKIEMKGAIKNE